MAWTLTIVAIVVLTLATLVISRWGATDHQEDLNTHSDGDDLVSTGPDERTPRTDRPAGPEAEAMGADLGHPTPRQDR